MRLEYYLRETAAGLRRNGIVAFAAMSTAFIALFLFGLALLIARQFNLVIEAWTGNVQVAVYLSDPARPQTVTRIQSNLEQLPAVSSIEYWDKTETCAQFDQLYLEGAESGRVMCIPLHPFQSGRPHRVDPLDRALAHIKAHPGIWLATGKEIADWYFASHYDGVVAHLAARRDRTERESPS